MAIVASIQQNMKIDKRKKKELLTKRNRYMFFFAFQKPSRQGFYKKKEIQCRVVPCVAQGNLIVVFHHKISCSGRKKTTTEYDSIEIFFLNWYYNRKGLTN